MVNLHGIFLLDIFILDFGHLACIYHVCQNQDFLENMHT